MKEFGKRRGPRVVPALPSACYLVLGKHEIGVVALAGILIEIRLFGRRARGVREFVGGDFIDHHATLNEVFEDRLREAAFLALFYFHDQKIAARGGGLALVPGVVVWWWRGVSGCGSVS